MTTMNSALQARQSRVTQPAVFGGPCNLSIVTFPAKFPLHDLVHGDVIRARAHLETGIDPGPVATAFLRFTDTGEEEVGPTHDLAELAAEGLAVIMVSSEIPEVLGMSDRVIVMREGRIAAELSGDELSPETLVRHAAGI